MVTMRREDYCCENSNLQILDVSQGFFVLRCCGIADDVDAILTAAFDGQAFEVKRLLEGGMDMNSRQMDAMT